jgi:hypothetical protein
VTRKRCWEYDWVLEMQAMQRAGITPPHSGARLSAGQLQTILADKSISERISLRMLIAQAGIEPDAR